MTLCITAGYQSSDRLSENMKQMPHLKEFMGAKLNETWIREFIKTNEDSLRTIGRNYL